MFLVKRKTGMDDAPSEVEVVVVLAHDMQVACDIQDNTSADWVLWYKPMSWMGWSGLITGMRTGLTVSDRPSLPWLWVYRSPILLLCHPRLVVAGNLEKVKIWKKSGNLEKVNVVCRSSSVWTEDLARTCRDTKCWSANKYTDQSIWLTLQGRFHWSLTYVSYMSVGK